MILQPCGVELTKVHYYDNTKRSHNMSVSTISREMYQNSFNKNVVIKKNIFGHRWVLKINELEEDPKKKKHGKLKLVGYILIILSIAMAVCFGIIFSLDHNIFRAENKNTPNDHVTNYGINKTIFQNYSITERKNVVKNKSLQIMLIPSHLNETMDVTKAINREENKTITNKVSTNLKKLYCHNCTKEEVCIKTEETEKPKCIKMVDFKDPTGCGGLCKINTEYCKNLDKNYHVYQCLRLKNLLNCPKNTFNCENMCISMEKRCDGHIDCLNMMDEKHCECNLETHFHCGNETSCIENEKLCNGKVDCWDKSDELHCAGVRCKGNHVPCLNGQCIPKEKMCDRVFDCLDRTDEPLWCQNIRHTNYNRVFLLTPTIPMPGNAIEMLYLCQILSRLHKYPISKFNCFGARNNYKSTFYQIISGESSM